MNSKECARCGRDNRADARKCLDCGFMVTPKVDRGDFLKARRGYIKTLCDSGHTPGQIREIINLVDDKHVHALIDAGDENARIAKR